METGFSAAEDGFDLHFAGRLILSHRGEAPVLAMARGNPAIAMVRGNFRIEDAPVDMVALRQWAMDDDAVILSDDQGAAARLRFVDSAVEVTLLREGFDRIHLHFHAQSGEAVWGGGEQMSYLALNGRAFPIWTSEPGVGRDKSTALTRLMDEQGMAGGDYWNTNYPQPTFLTSRWLAVHCAAESYSVLDFTDPARHRVEVWSAATRFELFAGDGPQDLVGTLSARFGRQPPLPDW
ncbi:MAG: alpha-glucosidase, partial [Sphingomonadales bacterium]|nr:alpha-glucosidase [Sphingomonadales bacterium]